MRMFPKSEPISKTIVAITLLAMIGFPVGWCLVLAMRLMVAMIE